ncbi:hypothetical protein BV902_12960 [Sphingobacterium sp. B29]|uniref:hypothetical protein n=1 Tax=Sphingobacterium sp. B29 TaxID=1933220 RepID=UPI0009584B57|nr:hypothetical protein [Sphingobacterium sp. B29]APU97148.1 hypothetical protein BV902_12960 [Sphingobacterium sp. B29]
MSKKASIKVNPYSFHLVVHAIEQFEKENKAILVNTISLSKFLTAQSIVGKSSISIEVRIVLLRAYGYEPTEEMIKNLKDTKEISDFEFSDLDILSITKELDDIIKKHNPSVKKLTVNKVKNCDTVGDLVKMLEGIAYP